MWIRFAGSLWCVCAGVLLVCAVTTRLSITTISLSNLPKIYAEHVKQCTTKIYLYEIPDLLFDPVHNNTWDLENATEEKVFGATVNSRRWLRFRSQYSLAEIIFYRLYRSQCRVMDPEDADLLFVPTWISFGLNEACEAFGNQSLSVLTHLQHLNDHNAHRHVFVTSREHFTYRRCRGWFREPDGLLRRAVRLANSPMLPWTMRQDLKYMTWGAEEFFDEKAGDEAVAAAGGSTYPNLHALPFPSSVVWSRHWRVDPPWAHRVRREHLMLFHGWDSHGDVAVRQRIVSTCKGYGDDAVCLVQPGFWSKDESERVLVKQTGTFCLEPAGDTPFRKSLTDSIALGCIPVLFHDATDLSSDLLWADLKNETRILINRAEFLAGDVDLKETLSGLPTERVSAMQAKLEELAPRWVYALEDSMNDSLAYLLHRLHENAQSKIIL